MQNEQFNWTKKEAKNGTWYGYLDEHGNFIAHGIGGRPAYIAYDLSQKTSSKTNVLNRNSTSVKISFWRHGKLHNPFGSARIWDDHDVLDAKSTTSDTAILNLYLDGNHYYDVNLFRRDAKKWIAIDVIKDDILVDVLDI